MAGVQRDVITGHCDCKTGELTNPPQAEDRCRVASSWSVRTEKRSVPGSQEEPSGCLALPMAPSAYLIYDRSLPTSMSLVQGQTAATLQGHQDGKSLAIRGHSVQQQNGLHPHGPELSQILLLPPLQEGQSGCCPDTQVQFFF